MQVYKANNERCSHLQKYNQNGSFTRSVVVLQFFFLACLFVSKVSFFSLNLNCQNQDDVSLGLLSST